LTPLRIWAQVQSKVDKTRKKFNQLKQEHEESSSGQCTWPWFEQCLLIWGKITNACGIVSNMDNGVPIDSMDGFV